MGGVDAVGAAAFGETAGAGQRRSFMDDTVREPNGTRLRAEGGRRRRFPFGHAAMGTVQRHGLILRMDIASEKRENSMTYIVFSGLTRTDTPVRPDGVLPDNRAA